jgi:curved DNA-binding protein CbpA
MSGGEHVRREDAGSVLGVSLQASSEEIRRAYLRKIKEHPPDRSPVEFEKIRDAYELLRDPRRRIELLLFSADPEAPLSSLLENSAPSRKFVGPGPWLDAMREG